MALPMLALDAGLRAEFNEKFPDWADRPGMFESYAYGRLLDLTAGLTHEDALSYRIYREMAQDIATKGQAVMDAAAEKAVA